MSYTTTQSGEPSLTYPKRNTPLWKGIMLSFGFLMVVAVGPVIFPSDTPPSAQASETQSGQYAKCYFPVAGWVVMERRCDSVHQLPASVKKCIWGLAGSALVAGAIGAPLLPGIAGALIGCGGELIK